MPPQTITLPRDANGVPLQGTYKTLTSGTKTVTTSGTRVQLISTATECKRIDVVADSNNSGIIYVGGATTLASTITGIPLTPTGSYTFYITDVSNVYIDSTASGDKVSFVYFD